MRSRAEFLFLIIAVAVFSTIVAAVGPVPAGGLQVRLPESRPLGGLEEYERLVDNSELLLIARVLRIGSATMEYTHPDPATESLRRNVGIRAVVRRSALEPVAWLRGGLDGEEIEVSALETPPSDPGVVAIRAKESLPTWNRIAGIDTLGAIVRLRRSGNDWMLDWQGEAGMDAGFRVLPQRDFRSVRDSIVEARERMSVDVLIARADVIVVTADSLDIPGLERRDPALVAVARVLKGARVGNTVAVEPWRRYRCASGDVLFLVGRGPYEPIPFHRGRPPTFDIEAPGGMTPVEIESAVRTALSRGEPRKSWR